MNVLVQNIYFRLIQGETGHFAVEKVLIGHMVVYSHFTFSLLLFA